MGELGWRFRTSEVDLATEISEATEITQNGKMKKDSSLTQVFAIRSQAS